MTVPGWLAAMVVAGVANGAEPTTVGPAPADEGATVEGDREAPPAADAPKDEAPRAEAPKADAAPADAPKADGKHEEAPKAKKPEWYEVIKVRGYTQLRYNNLPSADVNPDMKNSQGDRYIGGEQGFGIRRARLIFYGDVHPQVAFYFQTDFASVVSDNYHVPTLRDLYADVFLTKGKELRLRLGQSKVPFGWENLQSSQNRLAFDRNDALNSALKDERDLGVFAYLETKEARKLFKSLVDDNLKGSGDYGMLGLGVYNGQTANKADDNGNFHVVGRFTYPIEIGSQIIEVGTAAYTGLYEVPIADAEDGTVYTAPDDGNLRDQRAEFSFCLYPKPIGLFAEYNLGEGPSQVEGNPTRIDVEPLSGGYVQLLAKIDHPANTVAMFPYVRGTMYQGGKKFETNAPRYEIMELETGLEWQLVKALETTLAYTIADRTSSSYPYDQEQGHLLRAQVQFNY